MNEKQRRELMRRTAWMMLAIITLFFVLPIAVVLADLPAPGEPGAPDDPRYCGEPARDKRGQIKRSRSELRKFAAVFPCPSSLEPTAACVGWAIDHTIPLAKGGCDTVANMTWLNDEIKSCAGTACKDRWERHYHAIPREKVVVK